MTRGELALLARTAAGLQPGQVTSRARLRAQRAALRRWPAAGRRLLAGPLPAGARGWPEEFMPVDSGAGLPWPSRTELESGRIELLGVARDLAAARDWQQADAPQLWRFHLHYWDWAWGLATDQDRAAARVVFARLWDSWSAASAFGSGDAWLPYPAALRAWSWCGQYRDLVAGTGLQDRFVAELAVHAGFLRRHLEADVGGNHLIKGLKALAGLAVFFADAPLLRRILSRLNRQLDVQVLADGGHYERAPAYHCQVLADLIDIAGLVRAAGGPPAPELTAAISRMRRWLAVVLLPDGTVPLLNDGYPVPAALVAALRLPPRPQAPLVTLPDTGLVRATAGGWHLLADVGEPCPDELPAHAHADTFGCLLQVDGQPVLVDTGTSTYAPGPARDYERSTAAHSTVEVDGSDSTEVWGAFRAGRRARVHGLAAGGAVGAVTFEAVHDGYRRLAGSPAHHRRWSLTVSELVVEDLVAGSGIHSLAVRWRLAPGSSVRLVAGGAMAVTPAGTFLITVTASCPVALCVEPRMVALGFQRTTVAPVLACRMDAELPVLVTTRWRRQPAAIARRRGEVA